MLFGARTRLTGIHERLPASAGIGESLSQGSMLSEAEPTSFHLYYLASAARTAEPAFRFPTLFVLS